MGQETPFCPFTHRNWRLDALVTAQGSAFLNVAPLKAPQALPRILSDAWNFSEREHFAPPVVRWASV